MYTYIILYERKLIIIIIRYCTTGTMIIFKENKIAKKKLHSILEEGKKAVDMHAQFQPISCWLRMPYQLIVTLL